MRLLVLHIARESWDQPRVKEIIVTFTKLFWEIVFRVKEIMCDCDRESVSIKVWKREGER